VSRQTLTKTEIDATTAGTTAIGHAGAAHPEATLELVTVIAEETGGNGGEFNVELGGNDVFSGEQSVGAAGTSERFTPDQNEYESDETADVAFDISSAGSGNYNVTVVFEDGR
jgi:hypothetical protein